MKKLIYLAVLICSITFLGNSFADVTFSLSPTTQAIGVGNSAYLDLTISGLTAGGPDSLGGFSLDVNYDDSILSAVDVVFSGSLGGIDLFEADSFFDVSTPGALYVDETSWLTDLELDALQSNSFILATIEFSGIGTGISNVELANIIASDAFGFKLTVSNCEDAEVQVNAVPIPSTFFLLCSGLIGFLRFRKQLGTA